MMTQTQTQTLAMTQILATMTLAMMTQTHLTAKMTKMTTTLSMIHLTMTLLMLMDMTIMTTVIRVIRTTITLITTIATTTTTTTKAAIMGSKAENDEQFNTNTATESDMQYYVKITLINMWLILGLIVVVNICFYWCYCRNTKRSRTLKKGFANDSSDALGGVSEEENMA